MAIATLQAPECHITSDSALLVDMFPSKTSRHSRYYIQDSLITFLVEEQLFRVHRYFFEWESEFFRSMFTLPACGEGSSDESPIPLPGVSAHEFEALLDYFYFRQSIGNSPLPREHWVNLLSIASRYDFDDIRNRAIKEISAFNPPMNPIEMIELALKHDVPEWLEVAYCALCQRPLPLNEEEVSKLSVNIAIKISKARDVLRRSSSPPPGATRSSSGSPNRSSSPPGKWRSSSLGEAGAFPAFQVRRVVRETFWPFGPKS